MHDLGCKAVDGLDVAGGCLKWAGTSRDSLETVA